MKKQFYNYRTDGVTQGLLLTWMSCRQKAKWFLEGWSSKRISSSLTYGTIIHAVLEIVYDQVRLGKLKNIPNEKMIKSWTKQIEKKWLQENIGANKYALEELETCLLIAESTLPAYFKHWWKDDFTKIKWKQLEQQFDIPYKLKDGRTTIIRGKKDGVYGEKIIKLFETKTKSMINLDELMDTLWFEFQVKLYLWAIHKTYKKIPGGVTYNIIRRSGLRSHSGESKVLFAKRIAEDINSRPEHYFMRLNVVVTPKEMKEFEEELEKILTDFLNWVEGKTGTYKNTSQCLGKYGSCSWLGLCSKEDYSEYRKRKKVFNELEDY